MGGNKSVWRYSISELFATNIHSKDKADSLAHRTRREIIGQKSCRCPCSHNPHRPEKENKKMSRINCGYLKRYKGEPLDYIGWMDWAKKRYEHGWRQKKCALCGLCHIWRRGKKSKGTSKVKKSNPK